MLTVFILIFLIFPLLIFWLFQKISNRLRFIEQVEKLPGPPAIPIFGNTLTFKMERVAFFYQVQNIWFEYRNFGIVRFWLGVFPIVCLSKAKTAEALLHSNEIITKSGNYDFLRPWIGTGLLTSTGEKWRTRRKMLTPAFHFSILNNFVDIFNRQALILIDELSKMVMRNVSFDIFPFIGRCALDIICDSAMGVCVNAQRQHRSEYVMAVKRITQIHEQYERQPWLWIKPIFYTLGYQQEYDNCLKVLKSFTDKVIKEKMECYNNWIGDGRKWNEMEERRDRKRKAFLDLLLSMRDEHGLTLEDIREEVETFMFEGHDTTASAMSWAIFLLGHHPDVQEKVYNELLDLFGDTDCMPTAQDLKQMKYLECVIKESLRLYPPVPMIGRKVTQDFQSDQYLIPKGCDVLVMPILINRDPDSYGDDFDKFRPERFSLEDNETNQKNPFAYIPFSAGPRNCIGQRFALLEEKVILSTLIRKFKILSVDRMDCVLPLMDIILRPVGQIAVHLTPR